jgi:DNA-directed RNA polymerase specialized sigma24 family protein
MVDEEDAKQEAVMVCLRKAPKFDTDRGKAFNYFTTMILNHYRQLYRTARNYGELKKKFTEKQVMDIPHHLRKGLGWNDSDVRDSE